MHLNMFQGYFQVHYFCKLTRASSPFTGGSSSHEGIPISSSPPPDPCCNFTRSICKHTPFFVYSTKFIICWGFNSLRNLVFSHCWFAGYRLINSPSPNLDLEPVHIYWVKVSTHFCYMAIAVLPPVGFVLLKKKISDSDRLGYNHSDCSMPSTAVAWRMSSTAA